MSNLIYENNYIYIYNIGDSGEGEYFLLPTFPESVSDTMLSTFQQTNALARSAPIFSYSYSGPRSVRVSLNLHRDMMAMDNLDTSNVNPKLKKYLESEDYVDILIKKLQSIALPKYSVDSSTVKPPHIALRFGNEIFIKGVVSGSISVSYTTPVLANGKYARVDVSFDVFETTPFDAEAVAQQGSFRGMTSTLSSFRGK